MLPSELIDFRQNDAPIALWRNMVVLNVHHDGTSDMSAEWKLRANELVYETLDYECSPWDGGLFPYWPTVSPAHC
jgi:hypothetical protein